MSTVTPGPSPGHTCALCRENVSDRHVADVFFTVVEPAGSDEFEVDRRELRDELCATFAVNLTEHQAIGHIDAILERAGVTRGRP